MSNFCLNRATARDFLEDADAAIASILYSSKGIEKFQPIVESLKSLLSPRFGDIKIHFYGSRIIGVADESSDLDIFIDIGGKYYSGFEVTQHDRMCLDFIGKELSKSRQWTFLNKIPHARVPIIVAEFKELRLSCDISIVNGLGHCNSLILQHLFKIQPEAVKLVLFIKQWMSTQHFDGLRRYAVAVLVLFFLQQRGFMPTIESVNSGLGIRRVAGWEVQFDPNRTLADYQVKRIAHYKNHIQDFFNFYCRFNFNLVISVYDGNANLLSAYLMSFPRYQPAAIKIPGPVNRERNCEVINRTNREKFIELCEDSRNFFNLNR